MRLDVVVCVVVGAAFVVGVTAMPDVRFDVVGVVGAAFVVGVTAMPDVRFDVVCVVVGAAFVVGVTTMPDVRFDVVCVVVGAAFVVGVTTMPDVGLDVLTLLVPHALVAILVRHLVPPSGMPACSRKVDHMTRVLPEIFHPYLKNTSWTAKLLPWVAA